MLGNIIKFPNARKRRKRLDDVLVDRLTDSHNHVDIGHVSFTCADCHTESAFDFTGLVFKNVSFYCSNCGHGYKVSNPMFAGEAQTKSK